jgi:hypothetical protein
VRGDRARRAGRRAVLLLRALRQAGRRRGDPGPGLTEPVSIASHDASRVEEERSLASPEASRRLGRGPWVRLDHRRLGLPAPAVYIPIVGLDRTLFEALGFVRAPGHDPVALLPISRYLAVDVMTDAHGMTLMVFSRPFAPTSARVVTVRPDLRLRGDYDSTADEVWQNAAYTARRVILAAGPPRADITAGVLSEREVMVVGAGVTVMK